MTTSLFSTYRAGENRVTSTFLAVLQRLSLPNMDRILGALLNEPTFNLVTFENQPQGKQSTPDAKIRTGRSVWIETKTSRNTIRKEQVTRHLKSLGDSEMLLLLTPDDSKPTWLTDERVVWSNFETLAEAIHGEQGILKDEDEPPSEYEAFLLREFMQMLRELELIGSSENRVLVFAARVAWPMYKELGVYRGGANMSFRPSSYIAFSEGGKIHPLVPKIKSVIESVDVMGSEEVFSLNDTQQELVKELRSKIDDNNRRHQFAEPYKIIFLSGPIDYETVKLKEPIIHDKKGAFVQSHRYVSLESLKTASTTRELEAY